MQSASDVGKNRRLLALFSGALTARIIVPVDDSLIAGPVAGLQQIRTTIGAIVGASPDALLAFPGLLRSQADLIADIPTIVNLTASTTRSNHTLKVAIASVELAATLGAAAVAVHLNLTSRHEPQMLRQAAELIQRADSCGMPAMAIVYPRREGDVGDDNYESLRAGDRSAYVQLVAHAARVGSELGADLIKTQFTGDRESFQQVVECCSPCPVFIAGGKKIPVPEAIHQAVEAVAAGAAGISYGRNVFNRTDPARFIQLLRETFANR